MSNLFMCMHTYHTTGRYTAELRASASTPHKHVELLDTVSVWRGVPAVQ